MYFRTLNSNREAKKIAREYKFFLNSSLINARIISCEKNPLFRKERLKNYEDET